EPTGASQRRDRQGAKAPRRQASFVLASWRLGVLAFTLVCLASAGASAQTVLTHEHPTFTLRVPIPMRQEPTIPGLLVILAADEPPVRLSVESLGGLLSRAPISQAEAEAA